MIQRMIVCRYLGKLAQTRKFRERSVFELPLGMRDLVQAIPVATWCHNALGDAGARWDHQGNVIYVYGDYDAMNFRARWC